MMTMRAVCVLVVLLPALVLAYPYPQRSSEGESRSSRGKQRFNAEELLVTASDSETSWNPGRTGAIQQRSDSHEPETASSVVAPVTQQFLSPRGYTRRGASLAPQATEDKPRSRSNLSRRGPSSQESVERAASSRRREHVVEPVQVPIKSTLTEQPTFESSKDNFPGSPVEVVRSIPASEPSTSPRPPPPPPPPPTAAAVAAAAVAAPSANSPRRRGSFSRNSDVHNEPSSRGTFSAQDAFPDRQSRFESSRRRQSSEVTQGASSSSDTRRNGRPNSPRGSSRGTSTDFNTNSAINAQEIPSRSRSSGRRESVTSRSSRGERPTNTPSSTSVLNPRSRNNPSVQIRTIKDYENINNDIPVQESPEDSSVIASKRMDTNIDSSDEPKSNENTENISKESESSSTPAEEGILSSSETPSTPEPENIPKLDVLPNNRRKSSSRSQSRDHGLNDRSQVSRSQSDSLKAGSNGSSRRGLSRSSRLNDNTPDYSTNSNVGYEESSDVNTLNYRRDFSVPSTEQYSQRSSQSRRNQPSARGRTEEIDSNVQGALQRSTYRRNWEASKSNNEVNVDSVTSATASSRSGNSRRNNASEGSRRTSGSERRGSRGSAVDVPETRAEEFPSRRGSRPRTSTVTKAEVNSMESARPVARSGRRTPEADISSAAQRTSRRTSPDVGQRGGVKLEDVASLPTSGSADDAFVPKSSHKVVTVTAFTQQNDKAVDTEDDKEKSPNSVEDRKRTSNKVSSKEEISSTSRKEKTRKVNLLLAPSPPSESAEQGARLQSNDIVPQDKFRSSLRNANKNTDSNTGNSRTSTRQRAPSNTEASTGSEHTSSRTRGSFKTSRHRNQSEAPDVSTTPSTQRTTRTGSSFRHRFTQTTETSSGELSTSTVRSGFIPRPRSSSYKSPTPLPTSDTSGRNTYSSKTRSTLSSRRSTTPSVLETTPLATVQSSIAPSSPHRFSARYRNDLLRVTGALRVTTTPAYMPTVPTVSTTTSTTSTTDVPYVENSSEALTLDASSLTLDTGSLTRTNVDNDVSLESVDEPQSLEESNDLIPSSTEIEPQSFLPEEQRLDLTALLSSPIPELISTSAVITTTSTTTTTTTPTTMTTSTTTTTPTATTTITTTPITTTTPTTTTAPTTSTTMTTPTPTTTPTTTTTPSTTVTPTTTTTPSTTTTIPTTTTTLTTTTTPTTTTMPTTTTTLTTTPMSTTTTTPKTTTTPTTTTTTSTMTTPSTTTTTSTTTPLTKTTLTTTTSSTTLSTTTTTTTSIRPATLSKAETNVIPTLVKPSATHTLNTTYINTISLSDEKQNLNVVSMPPSINTTPLPAARFSTRLTVAPRGSLFVSSTTSLPPNFAQTRSFNVLDSDEASFYNPQLPVQFIYTLPPSTTRQTPAPYVIFGIFPNNTIFRKFPNSDVREIVSENEITRQEPYYPDEHHQTTQKQQGYINQLNLNQTNHDAQNTALYRLHNTAENEVLRTNAATFARGGSEIKASAIGTNQPVVIQTSTLSSSTEPPAPVYKPPQLSTPVVLPAPVDLSNSVYSGPDNKYKNYWSSTTTKRPQYRILTTDIPIITPRSISSTAVFIVTPEISTSPSTTTEVFRWKPIPIQNAESSSNSNQIDTNIISTTTQTLPTTTTTTRTPSPPTTTPASTTTTKATPTTTVATTNTTKTKPLPPTTTVASTTMTKTTPLPPTTTVASTTTTKTTPSPQTTTAATTTTTTRGPSTVTPYLISSTLSQGPAFGLRSLISRVLGNIPAAPSTIAPTKSTTRATTTTMKPTTKSPVTTSKKPAVTTKKTTPATTKAPTTTTTTTTKKPTTTTTTTTKKPTTTTTTTTKKPTTTTTTTTKKPTTTTTTTTKKPITTTTTTTKKPTTTTTTTTTKKPTTTTTKKTTTTTKKPTTTTTKEPTTTTMKPTTTATKKPTTTTTKKPTITTTKKPTTTTTTTKKTITSTTTTTMKPTTVPTTTLKPITTPESPRTQNLAADVGKGLSLSSLDDLSFLNSLLQGQQEDKKRPGRERSGELANKVIEVAIQRASTSTTTSHPTLTTKDSQLNFPAMMIEEQQEEKPRPSREEGISMADKVIEVAVQRSLTSTTTPSSNDAPLDLSSLLVNPGPKDVVISPNSESGDALVPRTTPKTKKTVTSSSVKLSPDEQFLAALLHSQLGVSSTALPPPKTSLPSKLSPDERFLAALLSGTASPKPTLQSTAPPKLSQDEQLLAALLQTPQHVTTSPKPRIQSTVPSKLTPDEQFLALLQNQLASTAKPQGSATKLTDEQFLAALLNAAPGSGASRSKGRNTKVTTITQAPPTPVFGGLFGQLGGRNSFSDPSAIQLDDDGEAPRGQRLVKAAIDVTKAVSQFMNVVIQGASQSFQNVFKSGTSLLSNYFSWGSSQAGNIP